jgi:hypothetical protein
MLGQTVEYKGFALTCEQELGTETSWIVLRGSEMLGRVVTDPGRPYVTWRTVGGMQRGESAELEGALRALAERA